MVGMDAHMAERQLELEPAGAPWVEDVRGWNGDWEEKAQLFKRKVRGNWPWVFNRCTDAFRVG